VVRDVLASVLLLSGVGFALLAGIGLQQFDDVFARIHAATKAITLGLVLVLAGAALRVDEPGDVAKLGLVAVLQFLTAPVAAHMVGRAAYRAGTELSEHTVVDELGEALASRRVEDDARSDAGPSALGADEGTGPDRD
jgi:multicomponent Na+:H+ antiporter subunit G